MTTFTELPLVDFTGIIFFFVLLLFLFLFSIVVTPNR